MQSLENPNEALLKGQGAKGICIQTEGSPAIEYAQRLTARKEGNKGNQVGGWLKGSFRGYAVGLAAMHL